MEAGSMDTGWDLFGSDDERDIGTWTDLRYDTT